MSPLPPGDVAYIATHAASDEGYWRHRITRYLHSYGRRRSVSSVANSESSATSPKSEEPKKSSLPAGSVAKSDGSGSDKKHHPQKEMESRPTMRERNSVIQTE